MEKRFPILNTVGFIPLAAIAPHENQALKNHYQTLERLAERGGLAWSEALAVLEDRPYTKIDEKEAKHKVIQIVSKKCISCGKSLQIGDLLTTKTLAGIASKWKSILLSKNSTNNRIKTLSIIWAQYSQNNSAKSGKPQDLQFL